MARKGRGLADSGSHISHGLCIVGIGGGIDQDLCTPTYIFLLAQTNKKFQVSTDPPNVKTFTKTAFYKFAPNQVPMTKSFRWPNF
jgi:hypothetical protein